MTDFQGFPKIARLNRDVIVTEKIDGTNAQVYISDKLYVDFNGITSPSAAPVAVVDCHGIWAGSRNRWLSVKDDNFGFAAWVNLNAEGLFGLGPGRHFGEWWGQGIQRGYGLSEKRFSLFNVTTPRPACVEAVPVLYEGSFDSFMGHRIDILDHLRLGSHAAHGFLHPEGIVVYHTASGVSFKQTLEHDDVPKGPR